MSSPRPRPRRHHRSWLGSSVCSLLAAAACGNAPGAGGGDGGPTLPCTTGVDLDGDHFGDGCPAGPDCNDLDPTVAAVCPDANCNVGPFGGCACDPATDTTVACYEAPASTEGVGACVKGTRTCLAASETWGICEGQVVPHVEICDDVDNDCDGDTDEGVKSACGNCVAGCTDTTVGDDPFPFPPGDPNTGADGVGLDGNGDIVLDSSTIENHFLWIANDKEGTVSKIDTRTGQEVARYASVSREPGVLVDTTGGMGGPVPAWNATAAGNSSFADNRPSRTAVDFDGNVWVANRAHDAGGIQPSATKIYNAEIDCVDRNMNMKIDTSREVNGTPGIQITDPDEFLGEQDECIAFTVVVGEVGGNARALAIDSGIEPGDPGNAWVGMFNEQAFYQLNGKTGELIQRVEVPDVSPYGAAIDSKGNLYAPHNCCGSTTRLAHIYTKTMPATVHPNITVDDLGFRGASYGITIDLKDRVWLGGHGSNVMKRYDPATGEWVVVPLTGFGIPNNYSSRGVGLDAKGNVWAAMHGGTGWVARVDADSATVTGAFEMRNEATNATVPVGVGVDFDGDVWTVNQSSSNASRLHIDQTTGEPAPHPTTGNVVDVFPTGPQPYTYSDFTGIGLRIVTRPDGEYRAIHQPCPNGDPAIWVGFDMDATIPPGTHVELWARVGNDIATIGSEPIYGPWLAFPADLRQPPGPMPDARYIQVIIRLFSDNREDTPIIHSYELQWACPGPG